MGWWLGDGDDHFDDEEQRANAAHAERERQRRRDEAAHAIEQERIEAANAARRAVNESFQLASSVLEMLEKEKFVRWYEDKFVPLYIEDRQVSKEEILTDLKRLMNLPL